MQSHSGLTPGEFLARDAEAREAGDVVWRKKLRDLPPGMWDVLRRGAYRLGRWWRTIEFDTTDIAGMTAEDALRVEMRDALDQEARRRGWAQASTRDEYGRPITTLWVPDEKERA